MGVGVAMMSMGKGGRAYTIVGKVGRWVGLRDIGDLSDNNTNNNTVQYGKRVRLKRLAIPHFLGIIELSSYSVGECTE